MLVGGEGLGIDAEAGLGAARLLVPLLALLTPALLAPAALEVALVLLPVLLGDCDTPASHSLACLGLHLKHGRQLVLIEARVLRKKQRSALRGRIEGVLYALFLL